MPPVASAVLLFLVVSTLSCSSDATPAQAGGGARRAVARYVVVAASDAVGYGSDDPATDAWPEVLRRTALPRDARLVNLGIPGATVAVALEQELAAALAEQPDVALVWLSVNDLVAQVPPAVYEQQLATLVGALRRGGATRVLVGNTPPLERLPIFSTFDADPDHVDPALPHPEVVKAAVDAYNAAIGRVAAAEGAEVVDLHAAGSAAHTARYGHSLISEDGFHPSTAGHRAVASAFSMALRS